MNVGETYRKTSYISNLIVSTYEFNTKLILNLIFFLIQKYKYIKMFSRLFLKVEFEAEFHSHFICWRTWLGRFPSFFLCRVQQPDLIQAIHSVDAALFKKKCQCFPYVISSFVSTE